ncbi:MAG: YXWGXW repeat-containing protein, partial [Polyangiaceae bacterium]|nr:YXWGXW repeat-containing protein [Polyangiaceae bacterium]
MPFLAGALLVAPAWAVPLVASAQVTVPSDEVPPMDQAPPPAADPGAAQRVAPAVRPHADLPPRPALPEPLDEPAPSRSTLASTEYAWIPGHWDWNGESYVWEQGVWVMPAPGYEYVPPRWEWIDGRWTFLRGGWGRRGAGYAEYSVVPVPDQSENVTAVEPYGPPPTQTVYVYTGYYSPPYVVYPYWHVWYYPHRHYWSYYPWHYGYYYYGGLNPWHYQSRWVRPSYRHPPRQTTVRPSRAYGAYGAPRYRVAPSRSSARPVPSRPAPRYESPRGRGGSRPAYVSPRRGGEVAPAPSRGP